MAVLPVVKDNFLKMCLGVALYKCGLDSGRRAVAGHAGRLWRATVGRYSPGCSGYSVTQAQATGDPNRRPGPEEKHGEMAGDIGGSYVTSSCPRRPPSTALSWRAP